MIQLTIEEVNYFAALVISHLLNPAIPTAIAIAATTLIACRKEWNAASRYCSWWLLLALVIAAPFIRHIDTAVRPVVVESASLHVINRAAPPVLLHFKPIAAEPSVRTGHPSARAIFLFCWLIASLLQLARVARGIVRTFDLKRRSSAPPPELNARFQMLLERIHLRRPVTLGISEELESPAVLGYRHPYILLPNPLLAQLESAELEQILVHELAHVQRWDDWGIVVQRCIEAIGIFHPFIAYLAYRINLDREIACDDRAAQLFEARSYAACLTRAAEIRQFGSTSPVTMPLLLERKSELLARVENLLDVSRGHRPATSLARLSLVFTFAATAAIAAAFTPTLLVSPERPTDSLVLTGIPEPQAPVPPPAPPVQPTAPKPPEPSGSISSLSITDESGSTTNWGSWDSAKDNGEPGTILFSTGGKRFIIHDKATLSEAAKIIAPIEESGKRQAALGDQQAQLGKQQALLGQQAAALANASLDATAMARLHQELADLESKLHQIDFQKQMKTAEEAMKRLSLLQDRMGEIQSQMGVLQSLQGDKLGKLGEQQGKLGEMQGRLGEMQGKLGEQQASESEKARKLLEDLVRRAQQKGLAQPWP